jgi:hypothetical protein
MFVIISDIFSIKFWQTCKLLLYERAHRIAPFKINPIPPLGHFSFGMRPPHAKLMKPEWRTFAKLCMFPITNTANQAQV